jgi:putative nucleotidyltransferase with HDIG domain
MDHEQVDRRGVRVVRALWHSDYIGEPVSQIEHMSQAAQLAMAEGFDDEVVLAAFFHDIGHLCAEGAENMGGYGVVSHERLGADYLREAGFSERMARLVEYHVQAKRYLTLRSRVLRALERSQSPDPGVSGRGDERGEAEAFERIRCAPSACACATGMNRPRRGMCR